MWRVLLRGNEWTTDYEQCVKEGVSVNMDTPSTSRTSLLIEVYENGYVEWEENNTNQYSCHKNSDDPIR